MVFSELGQKIADTFAKLNAAPEVDDALIETCIKEISKALLLSDVRVQYIAEIQKNVRAKIVEEAPKNSAAKKRLIQGAYVAELTKLLTPVSGRNDIDDTIDNFSLPKEKHKTRELLDLSKSDINVILFVGLQGAGKTTTVTKFAYYCKNNGWNPALVCADTFRAGAFDQLKQNATKARIPFFGSYEESDPVKVAREGVDTFRKEKYNMIIVDTSGRHKQEGALFDEMKLIKIAVQPSAVILVMDSHTGQACYDQAHAFRNAVDIGGIIMTKLDGHAKGGGALSAVSATDAPILFIGTGEHFEDFEKFDAKGYVSRILGMGDLSGLYEKMKVKNTLSEEKIMNALMSENITLRICYEAYQCINNMGPISGIMNMIPGFSQMLKNVPGNPDNSTNQIKSILVAMDSMTNRELDGLDEINESRIRRIAYGSGTSLHTVHKVLDMKKAMSSMGSMAKKFAMDPAAMMGAPGQNPGGMPMFPGMNADMLNSLGGPGGIMNAFNQMGGMGNMQNMMQQLGQSMQGFESKK